MSKQRRVSYARDLIELADRNEEGRLFTVDVCVDGSFVTFQGPISKADQKRLTDLAIEIAGKDRGALPKQGGTRTS